MEEELVATKDVQEQFGRTAEAYLTSKTHARDVDLDMILLLLAPNTSMSVLDVATGAGHTAMKIAPFVSEVVATDFTEAMLDRVRQLQEQRGITNVTVKFADAAELPFAAQSFDAVTCRIAPHHFLDIQKAIGEISRVLKPEGIFILEDSVAPIDPELDLFINTVERTRDRTHIRSYTLPEWQEFVTNARLTVEETLIYRKRHDIGDWVRRSQIPAHEEQIVFDMFRNATPVAKQYYEIVFDQNMPVRFTDDKVVMKLRKV